MRTRLLLPLILLIAACDRTETVTGPQTDRSATKTVGAQFNLSGSPQGAPLGLTGCWSGDGNAIDVVFGNNGTVSGSVSYAPGKFGQAFSFDGLGGDVVIAPSSTLDVMRGDGITLAAWFYPEGQAFGIVAGSGPILEYENGAQIWQHSQVQENPFTTFFVNMAASEQQQDWHIVEAPGTVTQNAWNHGVATYSKTSGNITSYINGVQVAQVHVGVINPRTSEPFHIGSRSPVSFGGTRYTFNGLIDEAQVYNRELTPAEVARIASSSTALCTTPSKMAILTQPAGAQNGVPLTTQPILQLLDASGVPVTFARTAVTVTIASGTGTLLGTATVNAVNGIATFTNLQVAGAAVGTTLRFSAPGVTAVQSNTVVGMQGVYQIVVTSLPTSVTSGLVLSPPPTVELRDAAGIKVASATNAVTASIGSGIGTLSGTLTVNAVAGVATFSNLIITGPGPNTLSFALAGSGGIMVVGTSLNVAASPVRLVITKQPGGAVRYQYLTSQPVVEFRDASGAKIASATSPVTVAMATGNGTLSGTLTVNAIQGTAKFTDLVVSGSGAQTLVFSAAPLTGAVSVTSASFTVAPAPTYSWSGFFDDVDAPPKLNKVKAGKEIDLEFSLGGDKGSAIFAAGFPASRPISCKTLASLGGLEPIVISSDHGEDDHGENDHGDNDRRDNDQGDKNRGDSDHDKNSSALSYNRNNRHYTLQWQTSKSFDDGCRALVLTLADGSTHMAYFSFSK